MHAPFSLHCAMFLSSALHNAPCHQHCTMLPVISTAQCSLSSALHNAPCHQDCTMLPVIRTAQCSPSSPPHNALYPVFCKSSVVCIQCKYSRFDCKCKYCTFCFVLQGLSMSIICMPVLYTAQCSCPVRCTMLLSSALHDAPCSLFLSGPAVRTYVLSYR